MDGELHGRSLKMLALHETNCIAALEELKTPTEGTLSKCLTEVRKCEMDISNKLWLKQNPDAKQQDPEQKLLELRRFTFNCRLLVPSSFSASLRCRSA